MRLECNKKPPALLAMKRKVRQASGLDSLCANGVVAVSRQRDIVCCILTVGRVDAQ